MLHFYTGLNLTKSQADSLLYQFSNDWEQEYEILAQMIANALIISIEETGWRVGKKHCYTWVFQTLCSSCFRCGVGRGKDILTDVLGESFSGIGVTDNYAAYNDVFSSHQLCWAHFLRKAIELSLRNSENKSYREFADTLVELYQEAKRYHNDNRLSTGRQSKVALLEEKLRNLCTRFEEEIITEKKADERKIAPTPDAEATMIRLQKELVGKIESLFVFVVNKDVEGTNNRSERNLRPEALARKAGKTSKTEKGAKRRSTIISVLSTLKQRLEKFTLNTILEVVNSARSIGESLMNLTKPPELSTPENVS